MKMKLRWKWNLSKRFSPKIYSYTVYTLTRGKKDKGFQFLATWELEKIILPTFFTYFEQKSHPPRLFHASLLFFIWKFSSFYYYSSHPYYFGPESNLYSFWGKWRVPQGSILGPLLLNNLTENLQSNPKLFEDDASLFTIISDPNAATKQLCADLDKIKQWAFQWKMSFNPDRSKQSQVIFLVRSKSLHIHQFSLITNQFNKFHHKNTWVLY